MDESRRKFLKIILIGSGTLVVGKIFDPLFSKFLDNSSTKSEPQAFKVVENKKILSIYDTSGEEVLQIDKSN